MADLPYVDDEELARLLDFPSLIDALEAAHRQPPPAVDRLMLEQERSSETIDRFLLLPAWHPGEAVGVKLITVFPENLGSPAGLPSVQALYLLFDGQQGRPLACLDGTMLTYLKTAADSALGARFLATEDAKSLLMVGAGDLAPYLVRAHRAARPSLAHVLVWNRTPARAESLAAELAGEGLDCATTTDLPGAAERADVISCATMAENPLILGDWLKPGCHLDLVGGYTPDMREADDTALRRSSVFVDSRWSAVEECGDITQPLENGVITPNDIRADLFELCQGAHGGRRSSDEITCFKNGGGGHLDLMTAQFLMTRLAQPEP